MKNVSAAFKAAMKDPQHIEHLRGTIDGIAFNDVNIISLNYSNACSDSKDVTFGSARIGQIQAVFVNINIPVFTWRGRVIALQYGLEIDNQHTTEWIDVGVFTVAKADWTDTGVNITAYDNMSLLDAPFGATDSEGNYFGFLELIESLSGVENGMTAQDCAALPNGQETFILRDGIGSLRSLASALATAAGGFATITPDGKLIIKSFDSLEVVETLKAKHRIVGSSFSDFVTNYIGITINDVQSGEALDYYIEGATAGVLINIGTSPLLQYGYDFSINRMRQNVANVADSIRYTPFTIATLNCPVYDLGDLIRCEGGVAGSSTLTCCVMSIEWTFKNTIQLQGFGADPNLSAGQSRTDRELSSLANRKKDDSISYYTYINADALTLSDTETSLYKIKFAVAKQTTITGWHEIKLLSTLGAEDQIVTLHYYYDDEELPMHPVNTYGESGYHMFKGDYFFLDVSPDGAHQFEVKAEINSGSVTIATGDLIALLMGQKMDVSKATSGDIYITEHIAPVLLGQSIAAFNESVTIADEFTPEALYRATQTDDIRETQDGNTRIIYDGSEE